MASSINVISGRSSLTSTDQRYLGFVYPYPYKHERQDHLSGSKFFFIEENVRPLETIAKVRLNHDP
jgi:hypothetical protein